jgi:hypothetical protein
MRKQLLITRSFQKYLKKLRRHFTEQDIQQNLTEFIRIGFRAGESRLKTMTYGQITISIVKLRIHVHQAVGRYLVGIINDREYVPLFIDLKTGIYGKNLSFETDKRVVKMLEKAFEQVLSDYIAHTETSPRLTIYDLE